MDSDSETYNFLREFADEMKFCWPPHEQLLKSLSEIYIVVCGQGLWLLSA